MSSKQKLVLCDYHRNGISGRSFKVGIIDENKDGERRRMLVIRPYETDDSNGVDCYVFDLDKLATGEIRFFHNSWRGDHYHTEFDAQWETLREKLQTDKEFYRKPIEQLLPASNPTPRAQRRVSR